MYLSLFTSTAWKCICTVCSTVLSILHPIKIQRIGHDSQIDRAKVNLKPSQRQASGFFLLFNVTVNNYVHVGTVSPPYHFYFLCKLEQAVYQYFMNVIWLVTDNNSS